MTDWKERAERAEAELARLRAQEPEYWQWRRKRDPWEIGKTFNSQVYATTADSEVRCLYAAPPAQPAEQQAQTVCKRTLIEIDARLRECSIVGASAADAYDTFYQHMVETALAAQPAEPVQRLSDERAAFEAWHNEYRTQELVRRDDTYYNTHVRCRWEGWQARAIESALQPGWRPEWPAFVEYWTHESHLQTFADRERFRAAAKAMLEAAPKATK